MNDHVGKPFVLADLVQTVLRLATPGPAASEAPLARGAADNTDIALLDRMGAIERMGGEAQLFDSMLPLFRQNVEVAMGSMQNLAATSAQEMRQLIHTLKGTAATMGASRLARAAELAEPRLCDAGGRLRAEPLQEVLAVARQTLAALPGAPGVDTTG
jgi:HPt (histidine-containing phosphotransfer) domain-containing protein